MSSGRGARESASKFERVGLCVVEGGWKMWVNPRSCESMEEEEVVEGGEGGDSQKARGKVR